MLDEMSSSAMVMCENGISMIPRALTFEFLKSVI